MGQRTFKKPKIKLSMTLNVQRFFREAGKRGGHERAKRLSAAERKRIARKAIAARWAKRSE